MKRILLIAALAFLQQAEAQDRDTDTTGSIVLHRDPRADALVKKQAAINAAIRRSNIRSAKGYRLLVLNTNQRDEALSAKSRLYSLFPDQKSYLIYQSPFFKLKLGNFRTRDEAEKYRKSLGTLFPKGVFIINDTIEVKPEKEEEL